MTIYRQNSEIVMGTRSALVIAKLTMGCQEIAHQESLSTFGNHLSQYMKENWKSSQVNVLSSRMKYRKPPRIQKTAEQSIQFLMEYT